MIDRIRQDIQERLDQLLTEAERLRQALKALGADVPAATTRATATRASGPRSRAGSTAGAARTRGSSARARVTSSSSRTRASGSGTKSSVLKALADANGGAMTASEVASATGLGRASVSTTLSKLAKSGEVSKAQRGYQLAGSAPASAATNSADGASA